MNREIDRSGLAKLVAEETGIDSQTVDAFIKQLFVEVEDKMIDQSLVRLDNLGLFRTIKSGATKRILFLGATKKEDPTQKTTRPLIPINERADRPGISTEKNKISDIAASRTNTKPVNIVSEPVSDKQTGNVNDEENSKEINEKIIEDRGARESKKDEPIINNTTTEDTFSRPVYQPAGRRNIYRQDDKEPKNKKLLAYQIIMGLAAVLVLALAFFAFFMRPENEPVSQAGVASSHNDYKFEEVENDDAKNISRVIVVDQDISLRQLSIMYYGDDKFWPYLFKANENIIADGYVIPAQSIVKIPRITVDLVEFNTGQLNDKLNSLAEEIALKALRKQ